MEERLKECPFCNSKARLAVCEDKTEQLYLLLCTNEDCSVYTGWNSKEEVIKKWNTRATPTLVPLDREKLRKILLSEETIDPIPPFRSMQKIDETMVNLKVMRIFNEFGQPARKEISVEEIAILIESLVLRDVHSKLITEINALYLAKAIKQYIDGKE